MWHEMVHPSGGAQQVHESRRWIMEANGWRVKEDVVRDSGGRASEDAANVDSRPADSSRGAARGRRKKNT